MKNERPSDRGRDIAAILAGVWRPGPLAPVACSAEVSQLLIASGGAALAWRRWRDSPRAGSPEVEPLLEAYRLHTLQAAVHARGLAELFRRLHAAGHQAILGKGWAIAALYPEPGLRPYCDFDLWVPPGAYPVLDRDLATWYVRTPVDLQGASGDLEDRDFADLYASSRVVEAEGVGVRVFDPADHLRLLCLHLLRHGGGRPLWLVDVAVAIENRPPGFDWQRFALGDPRRTSWAASVLGLAHVLLGAEIADTPFAGSARDLPPWLVFTVLAQWGRGFRRPRALATYLRRPAGFWSAVRSRWPNAIEATVALRADIDHSPRWPLQLAEFTRRGLDFLRRRGRVI